MVSVVVVGVMVLVLIVVVVVIVVLVPYWYFIFQVFKFVLFAIAKNILKLKNANNKNNPRKI